MKIDRVIRRVGNIVLTDQAVRLERRSWGKEDLVSIMLDQVAFCEARYMSSPFLFVLAGLTALGGLIGAVASDWAIPAGFATALLFLITYFGSRKQVIRVTSSGGNKIHVLAGKSRSFEIFSFISDVENAKFKYCQRLTADQPQSQGHQPNHVGSISVRPSKIQLSSAEDSAVVQIRCSDDSQWTIMPVGYLESENSPIIVNKSGGQGNDTVCFSWDKSQSFKNISMIFAVILQNGVKSFIAVNTEIVPSAAVSWPV